MILASNNFPCDLCIATSIAGTIRYRRCPDSILTRQASAICGSSAFGSSLPGHLLSRLTKRIVGSASGIHPQAVMHSVMAQLLTILVHHSGEPDRNAHFMERKMRLLVLLIGIAAGSAGATPRSATATHDMQALVEMDKRRTYTDIGAENGFTREQWSRFYDEMQGFRYVNGLLVRNLPFPATPRRFVSARMKK
jgi:hypothetical protein